MLHACLDMCKHIRAHFLFEWGEGTPILVGMELSGDQMKATVGAALNSIVVESGLTQAQVAKQAGMSVTTLQKLLAGAQDVKIPQFLQVVSTTKFTAVEAIERIEAAITREKNRMSAGIRSLDDLRAKKQQQAREMTPEQLDAILEKAGINDTELEQDDPDTP